MVPAVLLQLRLRSGTIRRAPFSSVVPASVRRALAAPVLLPKALHPSAEPHSRQRRRFSSSTMKSNSGLQRPFDGREHHFVFVPSVI